MKKNIILSPLGIYLLVRIFLTTIVSSFQLGFNQGSKMALQAFGESSSGQEIVETLDFFKLYTADLIALPIVLLLTIGLAVFYKKN